MATRILALTLVALAAGGTARAQSPAEPLPLAQALDRARQQSPALAAARARVDAARDAVPRAGRLLNPLAELRSENWASGAPGGLPLDIFATVTQTVELGGKRGARRGVAAATLGLASAAEALAARDLARTVTADYLTALRARDHARERAAHAIRLTEATRVMRRRVEVGAVPEADLLKLRTEETRAVVDRTRAELAEARALATLGAALGLDVAGDALQRPALPAVPATSDLPASHPDLQAAAGAVEAARAALDVERARARPDLGVNGGVKRTAGFNTGVVALTLPIPLFDRNGVARALADGQLKAAEHDRDATTRRLHGALVAARHAATTLSAHAAELQQSLVGPARGARDAAQSAFAAGALDVLRLVDAERLFVDAALVAVDIEIDAVAAAIEARLAAGEDPLP
jgi:cobalt-zinc-cadmium efflux system outer membrane protein